MSKDKKTAPASEISDHKRIQDFKDFIAKKIFVDENSRSKTFTFWSKKLSVRVYFGILNWFSVRIDGQTVAIENGMLKVVTDQRNISDASVEKFLEKAKEIVDADTSPENISRKDWLKKSMENDQEQAKKLIQNAKKKQAEFEKL